MVARVTTVEVKAMTVTKQPVRLVSILTSIKLAFVKIVAWRGLRRGAKSDGKRVK